MDTGCVKWRGLRRRDSWVTYSMRTPVRAYYLGMLETRQAYNAKAERSARRSVMNLSGRLGMTALPIPSCDKSYHVGVLGRHCNLLLRRDGRSLSGGPIL